MCLHKLTAPEVVENASPIIWAFVFIGIAIVLFVVEIFVPSGGLIALLGALSVIASLIAFYLHSANTGLIATVVYIVFGPVLLLDCVPNLGRIATCL